METKKRYRLVVMYAEGKTYISGRIYNSMEEVYDAMIEMRYIYAKNGVTHHVGFIEEREI